jgi:hypothetical protein
MGSKHPRSISPRPAISRRAVLTGAVALGGAVWLNVSVVGAQDGITLPKPGSDLRRALMDAIRPSFEAELGAPIEFFVHRLAVWGNYAYASVRPQRPGGKPIDWNKTKFATVVKGGSFSTDGSAALLERKNGRWVVVELALGPTDVFWIGWETDYSIPEAVFTGN